MNFYKRHIGDYIKDAGHLKLLEHGVYARLMDVYYTRESGIPQDKAARLIGASTRPEMEALKFVLDEFFTLSDGVWIQKRCEEEIAVATAKAEKNRENGKAGGRPKKPKPETNPDGSDVGNHVGSEKNLSQTPDTRHQTPDLEPDDHHHASSTGEPEPGAPAGGDPSDYDAPLYGAPLPPREDPQLDGQNRAVELTKNLRKWGVNATFTHPDVQDWASNDKVTLDILAAAVAEARETKGNETLSPRYLVPIVERLLNPPAKTEAKARGAGQPEKFDPVAYVNRNRRKP